MASVVPAAARRAQNRSATLAACARSANNASSGNVLRSSHSNKGPLAEPMMSLVHARVTGKEVTPSLQEGAVADFGNAIRRLEARLDGRRWLVSDEMTAADITCAAVIYRIRSSGILPWPADFPHTEELTARVMSLLD